MKKYLLTLTLSAALITQLATPVLAADYGAQGLVTDVNKLTSQASRSAALQQKRLQDIIKRSDTLITNRLTDLNKLSARVSEDSRLSADEKASLNSDIQTATSGLTTLKAKIDADTDATVAETDAKQTITNFKVYAVLEPKLRLLIVLQNLQTQIATLQSVTPQIQNLINTLQSQGKNTSALAPLMSDINSQLQVISTTISQDITTVNGVTVSTTNPSTTFTKVRQDLANIIRSDFGKIRADINQMRVVFKQLIAGSLTHPQGASNSAVTTSPGPSQ